MKKIFLKRYNWPLKTLLGFIVIAMSFASCEKNESAGPITISKIYLEDVNSSVPDREVTFARLGQTLRIEGSGFTGLKKVFINGYETYFNPVYVSETSMLIAISGETPTVESVDRDKIRFQNDNYDAVFDLEIRAAAPTITSISHTLPLAGQSITVNGTGLLEVSKVVFPGNVEVTAGIVSDVDGEFCTVTVPDGVSEEGGSLFIECANGGAYSPAYFNFKPGIISNFDDVNDHGFWNWSSSGSMINDEDLESVSIGTGNVSQGTYVPHRPSRLASFGAGANRCSETWTTGNLDWASKFYPLIPASTPVSEVAFQFDIYVPQAWSGSGFLKVCLYNSFNGGEWSGNVYNYVPWIVDGEVVPFQTTGWTTVTVPFSDFYGFSGGESIFSDVVNANASATYKNFGIWFENSDFTLDQITGNDSDSETAFASSETSISVFTDNWRIVSLETPEYSDFPE